jgi:hypothetical protein
MDTLKIICAFFCLMCVASAISGVQAVHVSTHNSASNASITMQRDYGRIWSLVCALIYAGAFYGIQKRAPIMWKLGWCALVSSFLQFTIGALSFSLKLPQPDKWIASTAILLGGVGVTTYWGFWWKRQKNYFRTPQRAASHSNS